MAFLSGCARPDAAGPLVATAAAQPNFGIRAALAERIDYEVGPCFGNCPVYRVRVTIDGNGVFTGIRNTAVIGERQFTASPKQYRDFAYGLSRWRPDRDIRVAPDGILCDRAATDMASATVRWNQGLVDPATLYVYFGCDGDDNQAMADAIGAAPDALPLDALIGERP